MSEPTIADLKAAILQQDGRLDGALQILADQHQAIITMERSIYSLTGRVRELENTLHDREQQST
jgi:hypothetical protein